jgi:hypothetical protein
MNRSKSASSSFDSGSSLDAANRLTSGQGVGDPSLWKTRSFAIDRSELRIAELALNTSSMNASSASGSLPAVMRTNRSCSSPLRLTGPNSSSGVEKRVSSRSK